MELLARRKGGTTNGEIPVRSEGRRFHYRAVDRLLTDGLDVIRAMTRTSKAHMAVSSEATASRATMDYWTVVSIALCLCGVLTFVSLLVYPAVNFGAGNGLLEWRSFLAGGRFGSIVAPNPLDISRDRAVIIPWLAPGQFIIPGLLTKFGLKMGTAIALTAGLCLAATMWGWIGILRRFGVSARGALIAVLFFLTFRYVNINLEFYAGYDPELQAATPWLLAAALWARKVTSNQSFLIGVTAVLLGFFADVTGILVVFCALAASYFADPRGAERTTSGMIGALSGVAVLYAVWFSRGAIPGWGTNWHVDWRYVLFAAASPWGAGISWINLWDSLTVVTRQYEAPILLAPLILFGVVMWLGWKRGGADLRELIRFTLYFYVTYAVAIELLAAGSGTVNFDDAVFRPVGALIVITAFAVADGLSKPVLTRPLIYTFCALAALYGISDFARRADALQAAEVEPFSGIRQLKVHPKALEFARAMFDREGRDAVFYLPFPDAANAFPVSARVIAANLDAESARFIAARKFRGTVRGHVVVLMPTSVAESKKGPLVLRQFADYAPDAWQGVQINNTTVYLQIAVNEAASQVRTSR